MKVYIYNDNIIPIVLTPVIVVVILLIALFVIFKVSKNNKKKEGNLICNNVISYLGNKENISSIEAKGSRLIVSLVDDSKIDEDELKKLGVTSIMKMSNKVTLVIGSISQEVVDTFNNQ